MPRATHSSAVRRSARHHRCTVRDLPSSSRFPISTFRPASASLKPHIAKKLALFHFLALFARKSNNTPLSPALNLALFTKNKAFFGTIPHSPPKTRIPAGESFIPLFPASSLAPRAFDPTHSGDEPGAQGDARRGWARRMRGPARHPPACGGARPAFDRQLCVFRRLCVQYSVQNAIRVVLAAM
jgi:hypothetical protein